MTYISKLVAPELGSEKSSLRTYFILKMVFHANQSPTDELTARLFLMFLVIVDKSVREYCAGRDQLLLYVVSGNQTSLLFDGLGRFETCIVTLKRAYRLLDRLKNQKESPQYGRSLKRLIATYENSVTNIRNSIEHMDEKIINNELKDGDAHLLIIDSSGLSLEVASDKLTFTEIHNAIKYFYSAGLAMIEALPVEQL